MVETRIVRVLTVVRVLFLASVVEIVLVTVDGTGVDKTSLVDVSVTLETL